MHRPKQASCAALGVCVCLAGCATVGVRPIDDNASFPRAQRSALTGSHPSEHVVRFLRQRDLLEQQRRDPLLVLDQLRQEFHSQPVRVTASVLAVLCYLQAKRHPYTSDRSLELYTTCLLYAYAYLFDEALGDPPSSYDPRFRLACDLYNRSLAKLIIHMQKTGRRWSDPFRLSSLTGPVELTLARNELSWEPGPYSETLVAYEYEVFGLRNHFRTSGLGVPLIVLRKLAHVSERTLRDRFLTHHVESAHPATVLMRVEGSILSQSEGDAPRKATVALYDPMITNETLIDNRIVPLETDLTTPLAYMLAKMPPIKGTTGLFKVEAWEDRRGLHMLHPYMKGRIPVVFVHGLMSEPTTWLVMTNDLMGDEAVRRRYQFWVFLYPTGNPILYSANLLRKSLCEVRQTFDPNGDDHAFSQMVLVGHSMGGVLSRLMIQESGTQLWQALSDEPIDALDVTEDDRALLKEVFFFEPLPFVGRAIFIAVPHRGSELADISLASFASSLVELPSEVTGVGGRLVGALIGTRRGKTYQLMDRVPTSIDGLSPGHLLSQTMERMPFAPSVPYHSIIGNHREADTPGGNDTVVPYESAHLEGAVSEKIVHAKHGCTDHPLVIREVRRILLEHAGDKGSVK